MQARGVPEGLPFIAHTGMWSDATLFAGIMATIMTVYSRHWGSWQWIVALAIGLLASAVMHWGIYVNGSIPEAHVRDGLVTSIGVVHFLYMAVGIAVVILFYTSTADFTAKALGWTSVLLFVHVIFGTLVPFKVWARIIRPAWYPDQPIFDAATVWTILTTGVMLLGAFVWARRSKDGGVIL